MNSFLKRFVGVQPSVDYSSVMVIYKTTEGVWRGFVTPFDITYEADSREEVESVLKSMIESYLEGLEKYGNPPHLSAIPLSDHDDVKKWSQISLDVLNSLRRNISKIEKSDYYAEAQLPA